MADNNRDHGQDRETISTSDAHEVEYVARKYDVSEQAVREAIAAVGNRREAVYAHLESNRPQG